MDYPNRNAKLAKLEKELAFMRRTLGNMQTDDHEAYEALDRSISTADGLLFEYELEKQPEVEDERIAA